MLTDTDDDITLWAGKDRAPRAYLSTHNWFDVFSTIGTATHGFYFEIGL